MPQQAGFEEALRRRRELGLYRQRCTVTGSSHTEPRIDGQRLLSFSSNDYLGLANHPKVVDAFRRAAARYGVGAGAAHLVTGHHRSHAALEEELADFTGRERALLFSTGYMANLGIAGALLDRGSTLYLDRLDHASLVDAAVLSRARLSRYRHADCADLQRRLDQKPEPGAMIATDGVFSMDGDVAPLAPLAAIAERHRALLWVDDAHGIGVLGETGRGSLELAGLGPDRVPILMGTLGKAAGTFGAFVAGSSALIETLIQQARSYIYTTALPPAVAEAARAALRLMRADPWRREHLHTLIGRLRAGLSRLDIPLPAAPTPIIPVVLGSTARTLAAAEALRTRGIEVTPIRPPTVEEGRARLRITLSAAHTEAQVDRLLAALAEVLEAC